ncbi:MAG: hypothetical protein NTW72_10640, partial [Gemmatimonadetes bacterium]|nr:hypothetical protein [Gemmatimonadota bacterium]
LQARVDSLATTLTARRAAATGDEATRLQAIEQRVVGGRTGAPGAGGGGAGGPGGRGGVQGVRQRLGTLLGVYTSSGARTGTMSPPTGAMRATLAEVKAELAKVDNELKGGAVAKPAKPGN